MFTKCVVAAAIVTVVASGTVAARNIDSALARKEQDVRAEAFLRAEGPSIRHYDQGTAVDQLPIWRRGSYLGNDPDSRIRFNLMRDGRGHAY